MPFPPGSLPPLPQANGDYMNLFNAMGQTGEMFQNRNEQQNAPPIKIKSETDDSGTLKHTLTMDDKTLQGIMGKMSYLEQALQSMTTEANRMQAQEQRARQNPLLNVLATVGGQLAQDPRLPPVVSALGRSSLALNPPPDLVAARRIGLEEQIGRTAALGGEFGLRAAHLNLEQQKEARDAERDARIERTGQIRLLNEQAIRGELSDPNPVKEILNTLPGMTPEKADALANGLVSASMERQKAVASKESATDERQRRGLEANEKIWDKRIGLMTAGLELKERLANIKDQAKAESDAKKAAGKEMEVPKTIPEKLAHLKSAETTLDQIEAGIKEGKYNKYMGVAAGRTLAPVAKYLNRDVANFFNKIKLQVSQAIQSTGAGARGFGPWERGYFTSMTESEKHSPQENLGIIDSWRAYLRAQRESYLSAYQGLRKTGTGIVLGKDKDLLDEIGLAEAPTATQSKQADPLGIR